MAKKDKKSKTAEQKARVTAKQTKKVSKGEKKVKSKASSRDVDSDAEDNVDLDAVLAAYAEEQKQFLKVTEQPSPSPPSSRSSSTILASPSNRNELFVFGGEYFDGKSALFFNDLYIYLIDRNEWRQVTSPNTPLPRSGHAWCRGGNTGGIYLFGGEFSSPKQGTFYHYNDFWHLDTNSREWTRVETKSKGKQPPARSGHRMTYFKNYIILFGGFQDTSQQTKYLQDVWIYDCKDNLWHEVKLATASQKPDPRSSFTFLPHETGAVLYGGYSRVKTSVATSKQSKNSQRNVLKPVIHQDTWFLRITPPPSESTSALPAVRWERRKRPVNSPNPTRAGATMAHHKGRGIMFGGVHDVEESEEGIESEFFNDLFAWNIDRNRFFNLTLRRPKAATKAKNVGPRNRDRGKADEEELLRNLAALQTKGTLEYSTDIDMLTSPTEESKAAETKQDLPVRFELPHPRFNPQMTVQDDTLFIFGGTFERGDMEFTFIDFYAIDLGKLDGVREIFYTEPPNWNNQMLDSDEDTDVEDEDEDDYDDEMEISDGDEDKAENDSMALDPTSAAPHSQIDLPTTPSKVEDPHESDSDSFSDLTNTTTNTNVLRADTRPFPRPFESLRDFYARTSEQWQTYIIQDPSVPHTTQDSTASSSLNLTQPHSGQSIKELRKHAFSAAEQQWWECREEIRDLEDQQEAAGIGDVVSLADRGNKDGQEGGGGGAGGGAGRRR